MRSGSLKYSPLVLLGRLLRSGPEKRRAMGLKDAIDTESHALRLTDNCIREREGALESLDAASRELSAATGEFERLGSPSSREDWPFAAMRIEMRLRSARESLKRVREWVSLEKACSFFVLALFGVGCGAVIGKSLNPASIDKATRYGRGSVRVVRLVRGARRDF